MITVVIPAYNEEGAIAETVERTRAALEGAGVAEYEILVVDDGSTDRTPGLAEAAGAKVIRHPHNAGYGFSLKHGIASARHDTIVIIDADATYRPENIPALLEEYEKGFHMVVGARTGANYRESALKAPLRAVLKKMVEFTAGRSIPDINSGLRIFSRQDAVPFFGHLCNTFSFTTSMTLAYMLSSKFVSYVPIPYDTRRGKTKVRLLRDSLRTMQYIVEAILYFNPIKLFIIMGAANLLLSIPMTAAAAFFSLSAAVLVAAAGVFSTMIIFATGMAATALVRKIK